MVSQAPGWAWGSLLSTGCSSPVRLRSGLAPPPLTELGGGSTCRGDKAYPGRARRSAEVFTRTPLLSAAHVTAVVAVIDVL